MKVTIDRLEKVREILATEAPITAPRTRDEWSALTIEAKRRVFATLPDFDPDQLPAAPTNAERALAAMIARAEDLGLPTTRDEWDALGREAQSAALRIQPDGPGTRFVSEWYEPFSLPRVKPYVPRDGYAEMQLAARKREAELAADAPRREAARNRRLFGR